MNEPGVRARTPVARAPDDTVIVYTAVFDGYDVLPPPVGNRRLKFVAVTPERPYRGSGWAWLPPPAEVQSLAPSLANRWCKFNAHRLFPSARATIYVDANVQVHGDLQPLLRSFIASGAELGLFIHGERRTVREEVEACFTWEKLEPDLRSVVDKMLEHQRRSGMPDDARITENSVLLRRHDGDTLVYAMDSWWNEVQTVPRDQLSLPYVRHRTGISSHIFGWNFRQPNPYFNVIQGHRRQRGALEDLTWVLRTCSLPARRRILLRAIRDARRLERKLKQAL